MECRVGAMNALTDDTSLERPRLALADTITQLKHCNRTNMYSLSLIIVHVPQADAAAHCLCGAVYHNDFAHDSG
jgi:hypothetical protein